MLNFHKSLPFLNWLFSLLPVPQDFPARFSRKIFLEVFRTRISCKIFLQAFLARFSWKNFPQDFPARFSCKIFPQDFSKLDPDWLAPYHPIPNAKFPPITAFLKLAFFPPPCPTRLSHKIFPQDFPELDPDWLAPHHPIPNAKFPPITAPLNRPTHHKSAKVSPPSFPQILWEPQIIE